MVCIAKQVEKAFIFVFSIQRQLHARPRAAAAVIGKGFFAAVKKREKCGRERNIYCTLSKANADLV